MTPTPRHSPSSDHAPFSTTPIDTVHTRSLAKRAISPGGDGVATPSLLDEVDARVGTAIGATVGAGWDTDCNGATVGALWGLTGRPIPSTWADPWHGRVGVTLGGMGELALDDLVDRTVAVARTMAL